MDRKLKKRLLQIAKPFKWLRPGMGVKRWLLFSFIGIVLITTGGQFLSGPTTLFRAFGITYMFLGIVVISLGIRRILFNFVTVLLPQREGELVDIVYQKMHLEKGYRIVAIGGGTGLSALLQGLKQYTSNITAVVTVADEGGSSGKLRRDFNVLPPGDIRNCLVALANTEQLMGELFQFRFGEGSAFEGHSFGNIFILAMSKVTKDFEEAVRESSKILSIRGQVVPSTLSSVRLVAELENGTTTTGENRITERADKSPISRLSIIPSDCQATKSALNAIDNADAIVLGPGSLYTSVISNLLVGGISEAINASSATKIYVCNIMTQRGETDNYSASGHIKAIFNNTGLRKIDYCLVNNASIPEQSIERYTRQKAFQVEADSGEVKGLGVTPIEDNIVSVQNYIRHNPKKLAKTIIDIISIARTEAAHAKEEAV